MSRTHHHLLKRRPPYPRYWMTTPGWWINVMMTRPQRRLASTWQRKAEKTQVSALDALDDPPQGRKPHHYFW